MSDLIERLRKLAATNPYARICRECGDAADALAELEKDRRDAERYRWLRRQIGDIHIVQGPPWDTAHYFGERADAVIDAAMGTASIVASNKSQVLNPLRDDFSQVEYDQKLRGD